MAGWVPAAALRRQLVLRRKFSASGFLPDVRRYGVTFFNYVGKPLTYILATPERPDDADNPLKLAFGNEGAEHDLERFATRFGCKVADAYGSTEGSVAIQRVPGQPPGALGLGQPGTVILDPATGTEKPPARFDANGRLAERRRVHRRDRERAERAELRGLLEEPGGERGARARAARTGRATSATATSGLPLLRGPRLRLAARRRRELRGRARRADPGAARAGRAGRGLRGARRRGGRPGDGGAHAAPGRALRAGGFAALPRRAARPRHEAGAALRAHRDRAAEHARPTRS